jgi:hypothetical protein
MILSCRNRLVQLARSVLWRFNRADRKTLRHENLAPPLKVAVLPRHSYSLAHSMRASGNGSAQVSSGSISDNGNVSQATAPVQWLQAAAILPAPPAGKPCGLDLQAKRRRDAKPPAQDFHGIGVYAIITLLPAMRRSNRSWIMIYKIFAALIMVLLTLIPAEAVNAAGSLDILHRFKAPVVLQSAEILSDGHTVEIQLADAERRVLIIDMGGWRLPGTMAEIFSGVPEGEISLRAPTAVDTVNLRRGGPDERQILQLLQDWKHASAPPKPPKNGQRSPPPQRGATAGQRQLVDRVIETLKKRN